MPGRIVFASAGALRADTGKIGGTLCVRIAGKQGKEMHQQQARSDRPELGGRTHSIMLIRQIVWRDSEIVPGKGVFLMWEY